MDGAGNLYIADTVNNRIRKVDASSGNIFTFAGSGGSGILNGGFGGDGGAAASARLSFPYAVAADGAGNIFIADNNNHRIREVDASTMFISTAAGSGPVGVSGGGFSGDGGAAASARLDDPWSVAVDGSGNLFIADSHNHRIRKVDASSKNISTVAGSGTSGQGLGGFSGDGGAATSARLNSPTGVALDAAGNFYVADVSNHRIRKVDASTMFISTVAGSGTAGFSGDGGAAVSARLNGPIGVAVDGAGNLFIADTNNNRIRKVGPPPVTLTATPATIVSGQTSALTWFAANGATAEIDNSVGVVTPATAGSVNVNPTEDTTYTLTVTDAGGATTVDTATVTVTAVAPPTATLSATDTSITNGQSTTLSWTATNANSARIDPDVGAVFPASGGSKQVSPTADTTYTLTITGVDGATATASVRITVVDAPAVSSFTATPSTITVSQSSTLAWTATGDAITAEIDQSVGAVTPATAGSQSVTPSAAGSVVYTLTVTDNNNAQATAELTIAVAAAPAVSSFTATPSTITAGQSSTLAWTAAGGTPAAPITAEIDQGVGTVTPATSGSVSVSPTEDTTYTLTVTDVNNAVDTATVTVTVTPGPAADWVIGTVAGTKTITEVGDGGAATAALLYLPYRVAADASGNLYIADAGNHRIRKVDADGNISTVAGNGTQGFSGDGAAATAAQLANPRSVTVDASGNLYIADAGNHRIRKVDADGDISTVAGNGTGGFDGDGDAATAAQLNAPLDVVVDGDNLYIVDTFNDRIRKVDADGDISTVAGGGTNTDEDDISATAAQLSGPRGAALDGDGNLYIANFDSHRIRKVNAGTGNISTVAGGLGFGGFSGDGAAATAAQLNHPAGVAADSAGNIYIADIYNNRIRKVDAVTGDVSTFAGNGETGDSGDNAAASAARLDNPESLAMDSAGNLYIADTYNHRVRKVDAVTGIITTVAGSGTRGLSGDDGAAASAQLDEPRGVALDGDDNLYIADTTNHRIRKVDAVTKTITTVAGSGTGGGAGGAFGGDNGLATAAQLNYPQGVALDGDDNLYIADTTNNRIRKVDAVTKTITTFAGGETGGFNGDDGLATAAQLLLPSDVAADSSGNIYIADTWNQRIRWVDASGNIHTLAGSGASGYYNGGFSGDGGLATAAQLNRPQGLAVDGSGNVYIADTWNDRIRKVGPPPGPAPNAVLTANPTTITSGQSATLTVASANALSAVIQPDDLTVTFDPMGADSVTVTPATTTTYTLTVTGANNVTDTDTATVTVTPAPTATLTASPATITAGQSATLTVTSTNAASAVINPGGLTVTLEADGTGSVNVSPATTTTYTLTVTDANNATATVTVNASPSATLTASPTAITAGQSATLTVASTNAASAVINPGNLSVTLDSMGAGSVNVSPATTTTYTLTVTDANNATDTDTATVTVTDAPSATLTASPTAITAGQSATLTVASTNAASAVINPGNLSVTLDSMGAGSVNVSPATTTTYTLTVTDANNATDTATVTVTDAPSATLTASPTAITAGQSATLTVASTNAASAVINPGNLSVTLDSMGAGSVNVSPATTTTYTLTVTDANNATDTATVTVTDAPSATLTASPTAITAGQSATLTVASTNAQSAVINPGNLSVTLDSMGAGSVNVSPATTTTYTLTVTDANNATDTDTATVTVNASPSANAGANQSVTEGVTVTLDGSSSSDPEGETLTYAWSQTSGQTVSLSDAAAASPTFTAPEDLTADATLVFSLTVTDARNLASDPATVTVTVLAGDNDKPTAALTADPATITVGDSSTLRVTSTNAASAVIQPGNLTVTLDSTGAGAVSVSPTATTTYTLTVTGTDNATAVDTATVTVTDAPTATLTANPETIARGRPSTLTWSSTNAVSAEIDQGVGAVAPVAGGSTTFSPTATTTYTLTVTDANGAQAAASTTITVSESQTPIDTVGGDGTAGYSGDGGPAAQSQLHSPSGVAADADGNLYIADTNNHRIRKIDPLGTITTVAGDGTAGDGGDEGPATAAQLNAPRGVAAGSLYIADTDNHRIRKIDDDETIATVAGDGTAGYSGDGGPAIVAQLNSPSGVAADADGNLYIADTGNHRIRKVDALGTITTAAGDGAAGYSGDGGPATAAQLNSPSGVAVDADGNLYIADTDNHRIRKVDALGTITTVAGDGTAGYSGDDGPAAAAQLDSPSDVAADADGNLYIVDTDNHRIRKVDALGIITTVAGDGTAGFGGDDGEAAAAQLNSPAGIVVDAVGNLYVADSDNHRIRKVQALLAPGEPPVEPPPQPAPAVRARTFELLFLLPQDAAPAAQEVVLYAEDGDADFRLQPAQRWIAAEPASGSLAEDEETTITVTVDPAGLRVGTRQGRLYIRSEGRVSDRVRVVLQVLPPEGPAVAENGVVNAAVMSAFGAPRPFGPQALPLAPGSLVAVLGENFTSNGESAAAEGFPLPVSLGGATVRFEGLEAPLFAVGPQRIEAQLPSLLAQSLPPAQAQALKEGGVAAVSVVVETAEGGSYPRTFLTAAHGPGVFTVSGAGTGQAAALLAGSGALAAPRGHAAGSRPARAGDVVEIYATGLGPVYPPIADGENSCGPEGVCLADGSNMALRRTAERPRVSIGGVELAEEAVLFSGLAPALAAVNLVVVEVPAGLEPSDAAEAVLAIGGRTSQPGVTIAVE